MGGELKDQLFILRLRNIWSNPANVVFPRRSKNVESMYRLGLVLADLETICSELEPENKIAGPCADDNGSPGDIWIFNATYRGVLMYLKFKLTVIDGEDKLTVLSFHEEGLV